LTDDIGTTYRQVSGEAGGDGHPWRQRRRFLPLPPAQATVLRIAVSEEPETVLAIPLQ
jgi:hypothetical protein